MLWRCCIAVASFGLLGVTSVAQEFRPRGPSGASSGSSQVATNSRPSYNHWNRPEPHELPSERTQQSASPVSQDLLQVYAQTKQVRSESDVTTIARFCAKVVSSKERSKIDQDYAASLLAWALNRRGEMRSEQAEDLVRAGRQESASKLDAQAADDFATAVQYAPDNWRHRHNFAISLAMRGEYAKAIAQLDQAIAGNPQYANAWFNRAELQMELQDYESAEQDYSAAIELTPDAQYWNGRGHCRFLLQRYGLALEDYRQAVEIGGTNAAYACDLGDAYQYLGKWEEAAKTYKQAVAMDNRYPRAYQNAAWLMATCPDQRIRNTELAMSAAKKALELTGERTAEVVETLAAATAAQGRHEEAAQLQREAIKLAGRHSHSPPSQLAEFQQRLSLYQSGQPYVQPQPATELSATEGTRTASTSGK